MPTRTEKHQIEDTSRAKFQLALPKHWVFRDKHKDYGIDGEVELFDTNQSAQGLFFWVQLRATQSKMKATIMNVSVKLDTLNYYKKLGQPVLLVRYAEFDDSLFAKWITNVDLFYAKKDAKTYRIKLTEEDRWNETTSEQLEVWLKKFKRLTSGQFSFPITTAVDIEEEKINGYSRGVLKSQIRNQLQSYSDFIAHSSSKKKAFFTVSLTSDQLKINFNDIAGCTFHSISQRKQADFSEGLCKDILLGAAASMIQLGQFEYCGRIIFENNLKQRLSEKTELLRYCMTPLFQSSYFHEVLDLTSYVLDKEDSAELYSTAFLNVLFSATGSEKKKKAVESFLLNRLENAIESGDSQQIGISHYNLANHYRAEGLNLEAVRHYVAAKRFASLYLDQPYYFKELGGVLFTVEKFTLASKLYAKSIELEETTSTLALYGDALMFAGEYEKAEKVFLEYGQKEENPIDEFRLKGICLSSMLESGGPKKQKRRSAKANLLADSSRSSPGTDLLESFNEALENDFLCGLAWFNMGITYNENGDFRQATFCFTMAGLVQNGDVEAWRNATLCALNTQEEIVFVPFIVRTAFFFNGEAYLESLFTHLENQNNLDSITEVVSLIEGFLPDRDKTREIPAFRLLNEEGRFENVLPADFS